MKASIGSILCAGLILAGCSATTINQEWTGPGTEVACLRSLLVVEAPARSGTRCAGELARELTQNGIAAEVGPAGGVGQGALARAREQGREGVLVCRFLERHTELEIYVRDNDSLLLGPGVEMWPPVEYEEHDYDAYRTTLYRSATGRAIWSATSDTLAGRAPDKVLASYAKAMRKRLEGQGLLCPDQRP